MYSVFAVDDEPIVLEGIRSKIDWEGSSFTFAGEATDGEIALSMIHELKPDILITDIKMPFMDGLQLAEAIKRTQPWIKIIILSGHDEFDYAKKAISIGIEEYLLKPFTPEELLASLKKAALEIDKERKQLSDISKLKEELKSSTALIKKEFLNNLVHGAADTNTVMQKCGELGISLISRYYKVLISRIESRSGNTQNQQEACSLLNSYSEAINQAVSFFHHSNLLVCIFKGSTQAELDDNAFRAAETIGHIVTKNADCTVLTAIGKTVEHLSQLKISYEDAKQILEIENKDSQNRIISSDDLDEPAGTNTDSSTASSSTQLDLKENDPLVDRLKYAGKNDISAIIEERYSCILTELELSSDGAVVMPEQVTLGSALERPMLISLEPCEGGGAPQPASKRANKGNKSVCFFICPVPPKIKTTEGVETAQRIFMALARAVIVEG